MATTGLIFDPFVMRHDTGPGHPEQPARVLLAYEALRKAKRLPSLQHITPQPASINELALVHDVRYIELVQREVAAGYTELSTGDTAISSDSYDAALRAAGSVCSAIDGVFSKQVSNAFCLVRPPGHHASQSRGMGFCLFNNIAIGARYVQQRFGVERVAIVDWDVHHGNGTQDIFYTDGSVLFFSTHQSPWYPGTGSKDEHGDGAGNGLTINCPLAAGSGQRQIGDAFQNLLIPALDQFEPEVILVSAGFDSRIDDPLGQFTLQDADFAALTQLLLEAANRHADDRLVSVLEGGYNLQGLASAAVAHVTAMLGESGEGSF